MAFVHPDMASIDRAVRERLPAELYSHSIRVAEAAALLAAKHAPAEAERARMAGLLHDIAKPYSDAQLLGLAEKFGILPASVEQRSPRLLHAPVGAEIAKNDFGIADEDLLSAIRCHTVGLRGMPKCAMILYIADATESEREFDGVEAIRAASGRSLREGCLMRAASTVAYVMRMGWEVDERTIDLYNSLINVEGTH